MVTALVNDEARNAQIVDEAIKHGNRGTVLIVSDRVEHCRVLAALLSGKAHDAATLTGGTPKAERLQIVADVQSGKVQFLISTLSLISEGFDASGLCVLLLATPVSFKGRIIQTSGRILRPGKGKRPLVLDFCDSAVGVLRHGSRKRLTILKGL
ncbi:MAG: helicase-related protein [Pseudomonadota bacterium]|nr:helicase-related protein [Pseudomonadota bacterium]